MRPRATGEVATGVAWRIAGVVADRAPAKGSARAAVAQGAGGPQLA